MATSELEPDASCQMPGTDDAVSEPADGDVPAEVLVREEAEAATADRSRRWWLPRRYTYLGLLVALLFFLASLTPTLLPRGPLFQGVVSGGSAAIGYWIGILLSMFLRWLVQRELPRLIKLIAWWLLAVAELAGTVALFVWFADWQAQLRDMMGAARFPWFGYPVMLVIGAVLFVALVAFGRIWMHAVRWVARQVGRIAPPRVSALVGVILIVLLTIGLAEGVVADWSMRALNGSFEALNGETKPDTHAPTTPDRSGGPGSMVGWDSLGRQGRTFVAGGPSVADLEAFNHRPATEPIRVYAGLDSADSIRDAAALVVDELERTHAFDRSVLAVMTTTGSGWINENSASALEYLYNGNTALASMQYSFLPSWISFLVDQDRAQQAGRALFDAVYAKWETLPADHRPKLVVFGESLGSFGGEAAFSGAQDLALRTDGALFVGPPSSNTLWRRFTAQRDPGSPQWLPVFENGRTVRFIARAGDLTRPAQPWPSPHVIYLQHASDPITWWSPSVLLNEPDWLKEPRGYDVLPSTRWFPIVTFLQLSADMAVSTDVPDGHGHTFTADFADSWASILQPPGWDTHDTARLRAVLSEHDGN
ncbi:alpha/beta hydrolase [Speluncibacter jeojiensis]|uniref:Alpha/beta-hydrolase family protein n=1 Tax=Speluncibacter jeojiensis TaxID=2710754 RepID=A0A9X4M2T7_9ACTN|nr:alpha/beta-hydrolase family protein [Corynebacteriales bacterium D3-21]